MMDLIKKSMNFGLGAAALSAEKLKQFADEAVSRGEMSSDEAKQFVDDVTKKAEEEKKSVQEWLREQMSKMLQQAGAAESAKVIELEQEIDMLEKRLSHLEKQVEEIGIVCPSKCE
ncbi:MAG: polyhydroxyalkanoate synthesis regulator [Armatimonadota bacterium]